MPGPHAQHLLVAGAVSQALTTAITKTFTAGAAKAGVPLTVTNIRPLHPSDPEGLSQTFFVVAILAPSFVFGNQLIRRVAPALSPLWQLALIAVYAPIVAAVAVAIADAAVGALTGAQWGLFGIGTLLAFAAAVMAAAAARWAGGIGVAVIGLLFIPIGIASSGVTLGPNMITPWYADVGKALPPGAALPAVLNTTYFNGNAITHPAADPVGLGTGGHHRHGHGRDLAPAHSRPADPTGPSHRGHPRQDDSPAPCNRLMQRAIAA